MLANLLCDGNYTPVEIQRLQITFAGEFFNEFPNFI